MNVHCMRAWRSKLSANAKRKCSEIFETAFFDCLGALHELAGYDG